MMSPEQEDALKALLIAAIAGLVIASVIGVSRLRDRLQGKVENDYRARQASVECGNTVDRGGNA